MSTFTIQYNRTTKARYYASLFLIYASTVVFAVYIGRPGLFYDKRTPLPAVLAAELPQPPAQSPKVVSGTPVRITIARFGIDLKVHEGNYDSIKHTWTLSDNNAHFAAPSMPPNDHQGNTLIYGHNHDLVLGRLRNLSPGDEARVYTENGLTFIYTFTDAKNVKPDDVTAFKYEGPPTLVLQTCTGNWNEWRGLYSFKLERIE
jgi:LPXTG-site transpeptidase (sortase) family protein